ncbi:MAG: hypothetical protein GXY83_25060 [Rhodopirellula sp.]|nr:hypothetical protein [Rhodopirellula sp.]
MKRSSWSMALLAAWALLATGVFGGTESASAQQVLRIAKFTIADTDKQQEVFAVTDAITEVFSKSEDFRWLKFCHDPETGEQIAVSLWKNEAAMAEAADCEEFKTLLDKMKRLTKGDYTAKTYQVYQPKKPKKRD